MRKSRNLMISRNIPFSNKNRELILEKYKFNGIIGSFNLLSSIKITWTPGKSNLLKIDAF